VSVGVIGKTPVAKSHKQNIWEQCRRHGASLGRSISTCVLQSVARRKQGNAHRSRFTSEVGISFLDKYHRLRGRAPRST